MKRDCQSVNHRGPRACDETWTCPYCGHVYCSDCEGTTGDDDPFEDSCDDCWIMMHHIYTMMTTGMEHLRHG